MRNELVVIAIFCWALTLGGCADMKAPGIKRIVTQPWDTRTTLNKGMTRDQVMSTWGEPDIVKQLPLGQFGGRREEWIYIGRTDIPIDYKFLSKTCSMIFEGNALVEWGEKEQNQISNIKNQNDNAK